MTDTITAEDAHLWLEEVDGADAMAWVRDRNAETVAALTGEARFAELRDEIRIVLDADDRIPMIAWHGERVYNLWKDAAHPRGLWRRTTLADYRTGEPTWDTVLDLDALAATEDENWVWQGATYLRRGPSPATTGRCCRCPAAAPTPPSCASSTWTARSSSRTASSCPRRRATSAGSRSTRSSWARTPGRAR
ncbi:hypothetical protein [Dactylosporangium cerinum]